MKKIIIFFCFTLLFFQFEKANAGIKEEKIAFENDDEIWLYAKTNGNIFNWTYYEEFLWRPLAVDNCLSKSKNTYHILSDYIYFDEMWTYNQHFFIRYICANNLDEAKTKFKSFILKDATSNKPTKTGNKIIDKFSYLN